MKLLALSDHDTVDGVDEALAVGRAPRGARHPGHRDLGRRRALRGPARARLRHRPPQPAPGERLLDARADRERRADAMAKRLGELGFEVDPAPIEERKAAGKPVGRPHLAAAVLAHPANAERLAEEGHEDVSSFIPAYLIQGKPGYVARTHPTVEEAIGWIHDAAGVAVWAHPFWDIENEDEVLAAIDRYSRRRARRRRGLLHHPHRGADAAAGRPLRRARPARAPAPRTTTAPTTGCSARFRGFDLHGREPNLGPIAHGTLAAPTRGERRPVHLAHGPVRLRQVHGRPPGRRRAARPRLPRGGARRRRRAPEHLLRARLLARGPRRATCTGSPAWRTCSRRNGVITFVAAVSPFRRPRDAARARMGERFVEVYVTRVGGGVRATAT